MGDEFEVHEKRQAIYLFNSYIEYPFNIRDLARKMGFTNALKSGWGALGTVFSRDGGHQALSSEDYLTARFGHGLYNLVFEPLFTKTWGEPKTLSSDIARTRIPSSGITDTILRALGLKKESSMTDAKHFYYPPRGFGRITARMEEEILRKGGHVQTGVERVKVHHHKMKISSVEVNINGGKHTVPCDVLISSIPINVLIELLGTPEEPQLLAGVEAAKQLQYRSAFLIYLFVKKEMLTNHHWLFFPGHDVIFGRVFEQKKMSPLMVPKDRTVLCCDFTDYEGGIYWCQKDEQLAVACMNDLEKIGLLHRSDVESTMVKRLTNFYPRYDLSYKEKIAEVYTGLKHYENLLLTGRLGFYNYNNVDHCVDMGQFIAENLEMQKTPQKIWAELEERVSKYRIVD
jgi:protoporphyrinogen oxidase